MGSWEVGKTHFPRMHFFAHDPPGAGFTSGIAVITNDKHASTGTQLFLVPHITLPYYRSREQARKPLSSSHNPSLLSLTSLQGTESTGEQLFFCVTQSFPHYRSHQHARKLLVSSLNFNFTQLHSTSTLRRHLDFWGIPKIVQTQGQLRWYGHLKRKRKEDCVSSRREFDVIGVKSKGRGSETCERFRDSQLATRERFGIRRRHARKLLFSSLNFSQLSRMYTVVGLSTTPNTRV